MDALQAAPSSQALADSSAATEALLAAAQDRGHLGAQASRCLLALADAEARAMAAGAGTGGAGGDPSAPPALPPALAWCVEEAGAPRHDRRGRNLHAPALAALASAADLQGPGAPHLRCAALRAVERAGQAPAPLPAEGLVAAAQLLGRLLSRAPTGVAEMAMRETATAAIVLRCAAHAAAGLGPSPGALAAAVPASAHARPALRAAVSAALVASRALATALDDGPPDTG